MEKFIDKYFWRIWLLIFVFAGIAYAANSKLTALTQNTSPISTDIFYIVDDPGGSPLSQYVTYADILDLGVTTQAYSAYLADIAGLTPVAHNLIGWNAGATGLENKAQLNLQFGQYLEFEGATANDFELTLDAGDPTADRTMVLTNIASDAIEFVIDGGGSAITTGVKGFLEVPYACTINSNTVLADQSGSIVIDVWVDTYANYPPTDADSITASAPPTISTAVKSQDTTLTGWTVALSKGDIIGFNVDSITTVERVTISLKVDK
jgi:hypothetical protein